MITSKPNYVSTFSDEGDYDDLRLKTDMHLYLRAMFMPLVMTHFPQHYLVASNPAIFHLYFERHYSTHPYFLRFSIDQLYQTIVNYNVGPVLLANFEKLNGSAAPNHLRYHLSAGPLEWFAKSPWINGFAYEKELLNTATGLYLLGLCKLLQRWPFLCYNDEFAVLCSTSEETEECLELAKEELGRLGLALNKQTLHSGEVDTNGFWFADIECKGDQCFSYKFEEPGQSDG